MNRYSEYGNDARHFLYFFLIFELIIIIKKKNKNYKQPIPNLVHNTK